MNLDHDPDGLDRLVMAEPEPNMVKRLEQRRERLGRRAEIVRAAAEAIMVIEHVLSPDAVDRSLQPAA